MFMPGIFELLCVGVLVVAIIGAVAGWSGFFSSSRNRPESAKVRWTCPHCENAVVGTTGTTVPCPVCGKDVRIG